MEDMMIDVFVTEKYASNDKNIKENIFGKLCFNTCTSIIKYDTYKRMLLKYHVFIIFLLSFSHIKADKNVVFVDSTLLNSNDVNNSTNENENGFSIYNNNSFIITQSSSSAISKIPSETTVNATQHIGGYIDKLENLERSVAAVLLKVAYGTTSTTKRSIPDITFIPSLTTVATPFLTTLRYENKSSQNQHINLHHRNYELDLERDHALPTSAPNADILKSNSNPTYPNPNRYQSPADKERFRNLMNPTISPLQNIRKKFSSNTPTISIYSVDVQSYSPPARAFFTPPLPPEYQNPFADKPTLRGTNNEGIISNGSTYIHRRPIPPPSLMPGHERIPMRPPDLAASTDGTDSTTIATDLKIPNLEMYGKDIYYNRTKHRDLNETFLNPNTSFKNLSDVEQGSLHNIGKEPSIRRILSGEIPEVLLKQSTQSQLYNNQQQNTPFIPFVKIKNNSQSITDSVGGLSIKSDKIGNTVTMNSDHKYYKDKLQTIDDKTVSVVTATIGEVTSVTATATVISTTSSINTTKAFNISVLSSSSTGSTSVTSTKSIEEQTTWSIAWNIHVYLSVILFTILAVYTLYKMLTYNKLMHLFSLSYFVCINLILLCICLSRIFYLCYDAYNIHSTFDILSSEILLNLPATFLTVTFSVLILYLFLKSLNHKNNRYSVLIRPLTVIVCCVVHVALCITLHYVESYTMQNHQQQNQNRRQPYRRQHEHIPEQILYNNSYSALYSDQTSLIATPPPPRVLSLICQIIYIFICLGLGLVYLYLYRVLKRLLHSKSQNYIHGFRNLSYAIHITIATALLFVLLSALQIFGAISISTRLLITDSILEIDWLQWGYQFSLRLIEIAIITLISWVTGLKTGSAGGSSGNRNNVNSGTMGIMNGDSSVNIGTNLSGINLREKQSNPHYHNHFNNHSNVAGFFLPCTSTSSQEQFDTDYPVACNANTNLHTYTMRTGKLIYDDTFALNTLSSGINTNVDDSKESTDLQFALQPQQPTYQHPYDTGIIHSSLSHSDGIHCQYKPSHISEDLHQYDYSTDATTDHYENPNFDLRSTSSGLHKYRITSTNSTTASSSVASGSSVLSQHQMLIQNDNCYSEPLPNENVNIFSNHISKKNWNNDSINGDSVTENTSYLEGCNYENAEKSSKSMQSCKPSQSGNSSGISAARNKNCIMFDRGRVRRSGTMNNIVNDKDRDKLCLRRQMYDCHIQTKGRDLTAFGAQTLALPNRSHFNRNSGRNIERKNKHLTKLQQTQQDSYKQLILNQKCDDMSPGCNVECTTTLINNTESDNFCRNLLNSTITDIHLPENNSKISEKKSNQINHLHPALNQNQLNNINVALSSTSSTESDISSVNESSTENGTMVVANNGSVFFRPNINEMGQNNFHDLSKNVDSSKMVPTTSYTTHSTSSTITNMTTLDQTKRQKQRKIQHS